MVHESIKKTPYVGPRPFERGEHNIFFGRDREVSELLSLIISHQTVLLFAQSGAGKSSLVNAMLIPQLEEEELYIPPVTRVKSILPEGIDAKDISNLFVYNTLVGWAGENVDYKKLTRMTITDFLTDYRRQRQENEHTPYVLIIDQFEEFFTAYTERWTERREFFHQLAAALKSDTPLRVFLVIREDYIAQLEPYNDLLPDKLRTRYRLEGLKRNSALVAVTGPLRMSEVKFGEGVAESLVDELLKINVETLDGETLEVRGEYVEPVQLQVVCQSLWNALPPDTQVITTDHLQKFGDIDQALQLFYENSLQTAVQQTHVKEGELRNWFKNKLITPAGTRGNAYRGETETEGIANAAVDVFVAQHLVRGEIRGGSRWYELTHDRFIDPILKSNREWAEAAGDEQMHQKLREQAARWRASGRGTEGILSEAELIEAEVWLEQSGSDDEEIKDYISACRREIQIEKARQLRRRYVVVLFMLILSIAAIVFAVIQWGQASRNAKIAQVQRQDAEDARAEAVEALSVADSARIEADSARVAADLARKRMEEALADAVVAREEAVRQREIAQEQTRMAQKAEGEAIVAQRETEKINKELRNVNISNMANLLAIEARRQMRDDAELAMLLGRQAFLFDSQQMYRHKNDVYLSLLAVYNTLIADNVTHPVYPLLYTRHDDWVRALSFQHQGDLFVSAGNDAKLLRWRYADGMLSPRDALETNASISCMLLGTDNRLFCGCVDGTLFFLPDIQQFGSPKVWPAHNGSIIDMAFDSFQNILATIGRDGMIVLRDVANDSLVLQQPLKNAASVCYSPDGRTLCAGLENGQIHSYTFDRSSGLVREHTLSAHNETVNVILFHPRADTIVATCSDNGDVKVWHVNWDTGVWQRRHWFVGHTGPVNALAFSPKEDENILASGGADKKVRLWDLERPDNLPIVLEGPERWVLSLGFSPDGEMLAAGIGDRSIYLWPTHPGFIADIICEHVSRNLSKDEWTFYIGRSIEYQQTCPQR
ncbi:hypothetical protein JXA70_06870 [candidate division KSB1 bacterium]|nr:hypothetical protein [candidate division KSB1 bacterium]